MTDPTTFAPPPLRVVYDARDQENAAKQLVELARVVKSQREVWQTHQKEALEALIAAGLGEKEATLIADAAVVGARNGLDNALKPLKAALAPYARAYLPALIGTNDEVPPCN